MPQGNINRSEEKILVARSLAGDGAAYAGLIDAFSAPVFDLLLRLLKNHADAEDAAQDVFIRAYKSLATFDPEYPFLVWLLAITHNRAMDLLKAGKTELISIDDPENPLEIEDPVRLSELVERNFTAAELWQAVNTLRPLYREALTLRHLQGLDYSEIAVIMKLPLGTVKTSLFRARNALKAMAFGGKLKLSITAGGIRNEEKL